MITVQWNRYPLVDQHPEAHRWLQFTANIGRAPNTVDAYERAVEDHPTFCLTASTSPETARPDVVAAWIGDMHQRPNPAAVPDSLTRPSRYGSSESGRSTASSSRKDSESATQSGVAGQRL